MLFPYKSTPFRLAMAEGGKHVISCRYKLTVRVNVFETKLLRNCSVLVLGTGRGGQCVRDWERRAVC